MSDEEIIQPVPEPITPTENQNSEINSIPESHQESISDAPTPPIDSVPLEVPPEVSQASPSPENTVMDKDQNPANEPFESAPVPENVPIPNNPNITVEKHGNDVTITEVMKPEPKIETAQLPPNEPLSNTENEQAKQRKENLKLANEKRQNKKRDKIEKILGLFADGQKITNDEVEKLLHVSDATATRYLETLEKEGKIKQVGKTGKGVMYEKI